LEQPNTDWTRRRASAERVAGQSGALGGFRETIWWTRCRRQRGRQSIFRAVCLSRSASGLGCERLRVHLRQRSVLHKLLLQSKTLASLLAICRSISLRRLRGHAACLLLVSYILGRTIRTPFSGDHDLFESFFGNRPVYRGQVRGWNILPSGWRSADPTSDGRRREILYELLASYMGTEDAIEFELFGRVRSRNEADGLGMSGTPALTFPPVQAERLFRQAGFFVNYGPRQGEIRPVLDYEEPWRWLQQNCARVFFPRAYPQAPSMTLPFLPDQTIHPPSLATTRVSPVLFRTAVRPCDDSTVTAATMFAISTDAQAPVTVTGRCEGASTFHTNADPSAEPPGASRKEWP
jgi:hypothetical protein